MDAFLLLVGIVGALVVFDALAIRFGADSRIDTVDTRSGRPGLIA